MCSIVHILWRRMGIPPGFCEEAENKGLILARARRLRELRDSPIENEGVSGSGSCWRRLKTAEEGLTLRWATREAQTARMPPGRGWSFHFTGKRSMEVLFIKGLVSEWGKIEGKRGFTGLNGRSREGLRVPPEANCLSRAPIVRLRVASPGDSGQKSHLVA